MASLGVETKSLAVEAYREVDPKTTAAATASPTTKPTRISHHWRRTILK